MINMNFGSEKWNDKHLYDYDSTTRSTAALQDCATRTEIELVRRLFDENLSTITAPYLNYNNINPKIKQS